MLQLRNVAAIEAVLIGQKLAVFSLVAGLGVGSGGFVLLRLVRLAGQQLHPETAQIWVLLWMSVSFTSVLEALNLDIFVGGLSDVVSVSLIVLGAGLSYLLSGRIIGRPWVSHLNQG